MGYLYSIRGGTIFINIIIKLLYRPSDVVSGAATLSPAMSTFSSLVVKKYSPLYTTLPLEIVINRSINAKGWIDRSVEETQIPCKIRGHLQGVNLR